MYTMDKTQEERHRLAEETQPEAEICREAAVCLGYRGHNGWDRIRHFRGCWWGCLETAQPTVTHSVTDI
jgi:hypothetical protein